MAMYQIYANDIDCGTYEAASEAEALEHFAHDTGYASWQKLADLIDEIGVQNKIRVREVHE